MLAVKGTAANIPMGSYQTGGKELFITLDDGDHMNAIHTCGDIVRGNVHLRPHSDITVNNLDVAFKCKIKTFITTGSGNNRRTHKAKAYLFEFYTYLIKDVTPIAAVKQGQIHQQWAFQFEFPWHSLAHPSQQQFCARSPDFENSIHTTLPPSFHQSIQGNVQSVSYYLEAVMHKTGTVFSRNVKDLLPLRFFSPREQFSPGPQYVPRHEKIVCQDRKLDPKKRDEHYGFRARTRSLFTSNTDDPDPVACFFISASVPSVCTLDSPIPITLGLSHDESASTAPEAPRILLSAIHARLTAYTDYRVPTTTVFGGNSMLKRQHHEKIDIVQKQFLSLPPVFDGMVINEILPGLGLGANLPPTFKTYNLNRWYILKVTINVIVGGANKTFESEIAKHGFIILPPIHRTNSWGELPIPNFSTPPGFVPLIEENAERMFHGLPLAAETAERRPVRRPSTDTLPRYQETDSEQPTSYADATAPGLGQTESFQPASLDSSRQTFSTEGVEAPRRTVS